LTKALALIALLGVIASACTRASSSGTSAKPLDFYGANPTLADVRSLLGDANWWPGPPSFGVRPLDSSSMPYREKFHVITRFTHIGTAETLDIEYTLWDTTSSATTQMTNIQAAFGTSASGPKVGDQVLYYGSQTSGAAPYGTATFVRIGQIITTITLNRKDAFPSVSLLGRVASKVTSRLKDVLNGKVHATPLLAGDASYLPPAGPDLTLLASVKIPIEAVIVMFDFAAPEALAAALKSTGVDNIVFGDYALNNDTHMEVRAGVFVFNTTTDAATWFNALRGSYTVDANGITAFYDYSNGQYFSLFTAGTKGALLVCRSTALQESASRACELPLSRVAPAWQLNLTP
jgi:hypothetical protein